MSTSKLMKVTYYDPKSQIRLLCYADTVVWDTKPTPTLTALRFGGYPERVQGLADAIYGGATIEIEDGKDTYSLKTLTRQYRRELSHDGVYAEANRLNFEPDKHDWYFPSSHHYQLQSEFPLGMTAEQFYNALQEEPVESVLNGTPLKNGELIEIDDGLASHFFYCYNPVRLVQAVWKGIVQWTIHT